MTATDTDLNALLERVKAAKGPDREIDIAIHVIVTNEGRIGDYASVDEYTNSAIQLGWNTPRVTSSIDAALALTERVLPGAKRSATELVAGWAASVLIVDSGHPDFVSEDYHADAPTAPLAILAATLQALISRVQP